MPSSREGGTAESARGWERTLAWSQPHIEGPSSASPLGCSGHTHLASDAANHWSDLSLMSPSFGNTVPADACRMVLNPVCSLWDALHRRRRQRCNQRPRAMNTGLLASRLVKAEASLVFQVDTSPELDSLASRPPSVWAVCRINYLRIFSGWYR